MRIKDIKVDETYIVRGAGYANDGVGMLVLGEPWVSRSDRYARGTTPVLYRPSEPMDGRSFGLISELYGDRRGIPMLVMSRFQDYGALSALRDQLPVLAQQARTYLTDTTPEPGQRGVPAPPLPEGVVLVLARPQEVEATEAEHAAQVRAEEEARERQQAHRDAALAVQSEAHARLLAATGNDPMVSQWWIWHRARNSDSVTRLAWSDLEKLCQAYAATVVAATEDAEGRKTAFIDQTIDQVAGRGNGS